MRITNLIIDPKSLENKFRLVDIAPAYAYKGNRRTHSMTGIAMPLPYPKKGWRKSTLELMAKSFLTPPDRYAEVSFSGLEVFTYWSNICRVTNYRTGKSISFDGYAGQDVLMFEEFHLQMPIGNILNYRDITLGTAEPNISYISCGNIHLHSRALYALGVLGAYHVAPLFFAGAEEGSKPKYGKQLPETEGFQHRKQEQFKHGAVVHGF